MISDMGERETVMTTVEHFGVYALWDCILEKEECEEREREREREKGRGDERKKERR